MSLKNPRPKAQNPVVEPPMVTRPLSKFELAEFVDVSERFIEKEVKAGRLTASILGKSTLRFLPGDVESWLKARRTVAQEEVPA